ncbi:MAG: hypothetical protein ACOYK9_04855 [Chlamydiia bacterium]
MKKIKSKSFLLLEILIAFVLVALLIPPLISTPLSLYKSLITNRKKTELFFEKKICLHDLMAILEEKKTVKNGEEIQLPKHKKFSRRAHLTYEYSPNEPYCQVHVEIFLISPDIQESFTTTLCIQPLKKSTAQL